VSGRLRLTLACGDYELTRPLQEGTVRPEGVELIVLTGDLDRIYRIERRQECDLAEFNVTYYFVAREQGYPITALPVFPHRRFRHGFAFVNTEAGIRRPSDLRGRRVGISGYRPAAVIWIRGILQDFWSLPWREVTWVDVHGILGERPPEADAWSDGGASELLEEMLRDGRIDGLLSPNLPAALVEGDGRIARLFPDHAQAEVAYYRETGIFPIMHVVTIRRDLVERHPWVVPNLLRAFDQAKELAYRRVRNPRVVPLAFFQAAWEEQRALLGPDPWAYGLGPANARNLETVLRYAHDQGLIQRRPNLDELFVRVDDRAWRARARPAPADLV
jgi:4,5-dihydroxyphthalate decarboxylase